MAIEFSDHIDLGSSKELRNAVIHKLATDQSGSIVGLIYTHTPTGTLRFTNGSVVLVFGRLDQINPPQAAVSLNAQKLTNVADPTALGDAATKNYVDLLVSGIQDRVEEPVRVAVATNVGLASPGGTLDGEAMTAGQRVLLYGQTTGTENDIWVWNGAAVAMTRAPNASPRDGSLVAVEAGSKAGGLFIQQATPSGARGTWAQNWTFYGAGSTYQADGTTLQLSGSTFSLVTPVTVANGGTGANNPGSARGNLGNVPTTLTGLLGDGSTNPITVTHNFGTRAFTWDVWRNSGSYDTSPLRLERPTINTARFVFADPPATDAFAYLLVARA